MKRSLIITLALIAAIAGPPCASSGWARGLGVLGLGGGASAPSGPVYTDCSNIGTASLYWVGDHSSGTTVACIDGGTKTATLSGGTIVASGTDPGTASPASGGNVFKASASGQYMSYAVSSGDIIDTSEGRLEFDLYMASLTGTTLLSHSESGTDLISMSISSGGNISFEHRGAMTTVSVTSAAAVSATTWTHISVRWSVANNQIAVRIGTGSWTVDSDSDTVTAFANTVSPIIVPYSLLFSDTYYVDNVTIQKSSGL